MHSRGQWPGLLLGPCPVVLEWGLLCSPSHITHFPSLTLFTFSIFPQTPLQSMLHLCLLCDYPLCTSSKLHTLQHLCAWASLWKQHWEPVLNAHAPAGAIKVRGCQGEMFIIHPGSMVSNYCWLSLCRGLSKATRYQEKWNLSWESSFLALNFPRSVPWP